MDSKKNKVFSILMIIIALLVILGFCIFVFIIVRNIRRSEESSPISEKEPELTVPHEEKWGIYVLDFSTEEVDLIYSSSEKMSSLFLSNSGDRFIYSQKKDGTEDIHEEIFTIGIDGTNIQQITFNNFWDLYPVWSSDDSQIAFLSKRNGTLDIYSINTDGSGEQLIYDSGFHDADISWVGDKIAFTRNSQIWIMSDDGTNATQVSDPPKAGVWGNANLPFGDYDPRISPGGTKIAFERLVDDTSQHGNYDIFVINIDGTGETRLTDTGYSQGFALWSHDGEKIVYLVAAIGSEGKYEIYMMNADGSNNQNITPDYFPSGFLCHSPIFSSDDEKVYFVGEWY